jgi:hypothetical protein
LTTVLGRVAGIGRRRETASVKTGYRTAWPMVALLHPRSARSPVRRPDPA